MSSEESPELRTAVQNHFEAIKVVTGAVHHKTRHRQSLICLSRRYVLKYIHIYWIFIISIVIDLPVKGFLHFYNIRLNLSTFFRQFS